MIGAVISIIRNIIGSGSYIFKSSKVKLDKLNNDNINIKEKTKIIKSLLPKKKEEQLKILFDVKNNPDILDDTIKLFKSLTRLDKIKALDTMEYDSYKRELLKSMSHIEIIKTLMFGYDLDNDSRKYMISLLTSFERKIVYKTTFAISDNDKTELLKYYPEDKIKKVLKKKKNFFLNTLSDSYKLELLMSLSSDEEKLKCFNVPNEYNLDLSFYDKVKLLSSLSDSKKLEFINGLQNDLIKLEDYYKRDLVKNLSDECKILYLDNEQEFEKLFKYSEKDFFESFSKEYARKLLINRNNYQYEFNNEDLIVLINKLDIKEKLEFLGNQNKYNINLDIDNKCDIIRKLPNKYKLDIINKNIYGLELEEKHIRKIIKSMDGMSVINLLVFNDYIKINLNKESIWSIIENLDISEVHTILKSDDIKIKEFIEKYKTSFVKCLSTEEKLKIIYNKSQYNIHLDDSRKIKILKSISQYSTLDEEVNDNIFKFFDNPKTIISDLINNGREFNKLHELFQTQLVMYFMNTQSNSEDVEMCLDLIKYTPNAESILSRYTEFKEMFNKLNISIYDFFQYGSNSNKYNWYESIVNILNNNDIEKFSNIKDYFFTNYYNINGDSKEIINKFLEILTAYNKYPEFCTNLTIENKVLSKEEKEDIRYLFNQSNIENIPTKLEEVSRVRNEKIKSYTLIAKNSTSLYELKDALFSLLFDKTSDEIRRFISYTGGTTELKILQFNNRNNKEIKKVTDNLVLVTSLIERIIDSNDMEGLKRALEYYSSSENLEHTKRLFNYCSKYEEFNRKLYEYDMNASLTNINNVDPRLCNTEASKELSRKYGGIVIDLSEVQYVLGAHVKSYREKVEDLLTGNADGKSNFICLSPTSHRGQHYYAWSDSRTVFAYDTIPSDSFICSSISNMGTNSELKYNSTEVPVIYRNQKNILETSEASTGHNAEILLYRESLKPCGIIVPKDTKPSDDAIEYHKKYNLPFIITQQVDKRIENPKKLNNDRNELNIERIDDIEVLKELKSALTKCTKKHSKRIAIIADPHALYEPTLACLVDIKNMGIDEIYSLGDNIGHGPNPREVLELLNEYGVKSIYGNHELYLLEGIEPFKEHFPGQEAIDRTHIMNKWIKGELTTEQIEDIKKYPERYEINLPKDRKLTLIHTNKAYNIVGKYSKDPKIDKDSIIIRGHEHFASNSGDDIVARGVGIGQSSNDDGDAVYYIVNINDDKYNIDVVKVPYDRDNLLHTINESNMPVLAKGLIVNWVGKDKSN